MPFRSKAQQRFMFAAEARGEVPKGTAKRWAKETPNIKNLPERAHEKKSAYELGFELALRDFMEKDAALEWLKGFFGKSAPKAVSRAREFVPPRPTTPGKWIYRRGIGWVNQGVPTGGRVGLFETPFATQRAYA